MSETSKETLAMLSIALEMEKKGKDFYVKAVEKSANKLARDMFTKLRDDEDVHVERILSIHGSLEGGGPWTGEWKTKEAGGGSINTMFRELAREHGKTIKAETTDIEALDVGIDFETKSIEFYQDHLKTASDPLEREFLERMMDEEKSHHELLVDMKYYLTDPAGWFAEQEKPHIDGA